MTAEVIYGVVFGKPKIEGDPASFLSFLSKDIEANPENLQAISDEIVGRISHLVEGVAFSDDVQQPCDTEPFNEPA